MSGFCAAEAVFKAIDDTDIESVEQFVREDLSLLFQSKTIKLRFGSKFEDAFGPVYASNPKRFKLVPGERKIIKKIITYVNNVDVLQSENKAIEFSERHELSFDSHVQRAKFFLKKLQSTADINLKREKGGFRFDDEIKMYATYLRMICGPIGYDTIQRNLEGALPSLVSTNRYIKASHCHILEGDFRGKELLKYLEDRDLPRAVCLSEDATRIVGRIQYDSRTNQIIGFTLPTDTQTGMPIISAYPARNAHDILEAFSTQNSISSFVNVFMAQPLAHVAPFCLILFGSDCKYTSQDVEKRWEFITKKLASLNIDVLFISSDSDPKYNAAMRRLSKLGSTPTDRSRNWFTCDSKNIKLPFYAQDPTHIGTKMRNFLLRSTKKLIPFGPKHFIELEHLYVLMDTVSKDQHLLTSSTLNPNDRQNFPSVLRMCNEKVTTLLKSEVKNSGGTVVFLETMRDILDSYMDITLSPLARVEKLWYRVFILRIWRKFISSHAKYSLKDNFLTSNCYSCVELNAHSLVLCILYLKKHNLDAWFLPHLYSSQPCESIFRQFRSFTSTFSTVANCSVKEVLSRISKIQLQNEITFNNATHFVYPRNKQQTDKCMQSHDLPTEYDIMNTILKCKMYAANKLKQFGFKINSQPSFFSCEIGASVTHKQNKVNKKLKRNNIGILKKQLNVTDLSNIKLKNYIDKHPNPCEMSSFVAINTKKVVKKSWLCWFLRNDYQKISSDRNRRVMALTEDEYINKKHGKVKIPFNRKIYQYKPTNKPKSFGKFRVKK